MERKFQDDIRLKKVAFCRAVTSCFQRHPSQNKKLFTVELKKNLELGIIRKDLERHRKIRKNLEKLGKTWKNLEYFGKLGTWNF